jgi:outer membrane efflux protein
MVRIFFALVLVFTGIIVDLGEAKAADTLRLTLNGALARIESNNFLLRASQEGIKQAEIAQLERWGAMLPTVDASGSYNRHLKKPVIFLPEGSPMGRVLELGSDNSFQSNISATFPLFAMPIYRNISVAKTDKAIAVETNRGTRIDIRGSVRLSFANCLLAKESRRVIEQSLQTAMATLENVNNLALQGMVSEYDKVRAEVQVSNLKPMVLQARQGEQVALLTLHSLIGIADTIPIDVEGDLESILAQYLTVRPTNNIAENSNLRVLKLQEQRLMRQRRLVNASHYPVLSAFANYQWQTQANDFNFDKYNWVEIALVGIQINVPLFAGFTKYHQAQQLKIGQQRAAWQRSYTEQQVEIQRQALQDQKSAALQSMEASKEAVALAWQGVKIARGRYNAGAGTILELTDAQMAHVQANLNYYKAIFDYIKASVEQDKLEGRE